MIDWEVWGLYFLNEKGKNGELVLGLGDTLACACVCWPERYFPGLSPKVPFVFFLLWQNGRDDFGG